MKTMCLAAAAMAATIGAAAWGADEGGRVAVVNMDRLIKSHPDTAFAESVLKQQFEEFETEQKQMQDEGEKLKEEFEKIREQTEDKALSETAREGKIGVAKEKLVQIREFDRRSREKSMKRKQEIAENELRLRKQIVGKIREALQRYSDKNGVQVVLDSSALAAAGIETVVYAASKADITDEIMKMLGGKEPKAGAKVESTPDAKSDAKPKEAK